MPSTSLKKIALPLAVFACLLFASCSRRTPNDLYVVKSLKTGLENSNLQIQRENETLFILFKEKLEAPETKQKAELLLPEMLRIKNVTAAILREIQNAQFELRSEASSKVNGETFYYEDNLDAVKRLFIEKKRASYLFQQLKDSKTLFLDSIGGNADFVNKGLIEIPLNESAAKEADNFISFFKNQPAIAADAFLERLKGDCLLNEKRLLSFINDRVTQHIFHDFPEFLLGINMTYFRSGEEIMVTGGIGSFRNYANSYMIVNGNRIYPSEKGIFNYVEKIKAKPGTYSMPVEISYFEADGNRQTMRRRIEYTVGE